MDVEGAPVLKHFPCDRSIRLMGRVNQSLNGTYNQLSSDDEDSLNLLRQNGIMWELDTSYRRHSLAVACHRAFL